MPVSHKYNPSPDTHICIWKIEEDEKFFIDNMEWSKNQIEWINSIHPIKKMEYLASRFLIYKTSGWIDNHLYKDEYGKLWLKKPGTYLSISHSGPWTGLSISDKDIGFDLQFYTDKIFRTASRFLSDEEYAVLYDENNLRLLTVAWCIKEAVYKCYGKKSIQYNKQIKLHWEIKNELHFTKASLLLENNIIEFQINYGMEENFAWVMASFNN